MRYFKFPISEMSSARMLRLAQSLDIAPAEAIGLLALFWQHTRQASMESGTADAMMNHLPGRFTSRDDQRIIAALVRSGYVDSQEDGQLRILDNVGCVAHAQRVSEQCKRAAAARIAKSAKPDRPPRKKTAMALVKSPAQEANAQTWDAYSQAYTARMGQPPVRNAKANSLIKQFVERIGHEDAPHVIAFYVQHPHKGYMARLYQLEMAVHDAESLRTQWARGAAVTQADFVHMDEQHAIDRERRRITHGH